MASSRSESSPSDLAEYAFCPRAREYRKIHGAPPSTPSSRAGERYHRVTLAATRRRFERRAGYWLLAGVGLLLAAVGLLGLGL